MQRMTAEAAAQHLMDTGAVHNHQFAMTAEDRHRTAYTIAVCNYLGLEATFENIIQVSRALQAQEIEAHHGHEYPKWVLAGNGLDVVVANEGQETFAARLERGSDFDPKRKSQYAAAEDHGGDVAPYDGYVAPPPEPVRDVLGAKGGDVGSTGDGEQTGNPAQKPADHDGQHDAGMAQQTLQDAGIAKQEAASRPVTTQARPQRR